jgi:hypothetical protein
MVRRERCYQVAGWSCRGDQVTGLAAGDLIAV